MLLSETIRQKIFLIEEVINFPTSLLSHECPNGRLTTGRRRKPDPPRPRPLKRANSRKNSVLRYQDSQNQARLFARGLRHLPDRRGTDRSTGTAGRGYSSQQTTLGVLEGRIAEPVKVAPHIAQPEHAQLEVL